MSMDTFMDLLRRHLSDTDFNWMMAFTTSMEPERRIAMMQFLAERETIAPAVGPALQRQLRRRQLPTS